MTLNELLAAWKSGQLTKHQYIDAMHQVHQALFDYAEFLRHTDLAGLEIADGNVVATVRDTGIRLLCNRTDKRIAPMEILNFGQYESAESGLLFRLLQDGASVFDIGANIGWYSINIAKRFPNSRVTAFEPIPSTFGYLQRNLALNQVGNVQVHNFAFSNKPGELSFFFHPEGSGSASAADLMGTGNAQRVTCAVRTLDDFVRETGARVDFIKCDVEGAELFVFQGGEQTLRRDRPMVFAEMLRKWAAKFGYHPNDIIAFMRQIGYQCFVRHGDGLAAFPAMDDQTNDTNFFFLHPEVHAARIRELVAA